MVRSRAAFLALHLPRQRAVVVRLEKLEREVLELRLHARHPEPMRQRRVDLPGFERDAPLPLGVEVLERPHVVQPIGELDDDDARVLRDRQEQLAVVLRLRLDARPEGERRQVGEPVHQVRDFGAEIVTDLIERHVGVFDHVVQQGGGDRGGVHLEVGQQRGDRDAVRQKVVARDALLAVVRLRADAVGARQQVQVQALPVRGHRLGQLGREHRQGTRHSNPASAKLT